MIPDSLIRPYLIICEGTNDNAFLMALLKTRNISGFEVAYPQSPEQESDGRNGFGDLLGGLILKRGFSNLRGIIILSDNDANEAKSFQLIQEQIEKAGSYSIPAQSFEAVQTEGYPALIVLMLPWKGELGNLETLCLRAAVDNWPKVATCLNDYYECSDAPNWSLSKRSKMQLRCLLAATCKQDPNTSLTYIWKRQPEFQIPLAHPCFDNLATFLKNFAV